MKKQLNKKQEYKNNKIKDTIIKEIINDSNKQIIKNNNEKCGSNQLEVINLKDINIYNKINLKNKNNNVNKDEKHKILNLLTDKKNTIINDLKVLNGNQKYIKSISFADIDSPKSIIDNNINNDELRKLNIKEKVLNDKISYIESEINKISLQTNSNKKLFNNKYKHYLSLYNNGEDAKTKEFISKLKNINKKYKSINQKKENYFKQLEEKLCESNEKDKNIKEKEKQEFILEERKKERNIILKRKNEIDAKIKKVMNHNIINKNVNLNKNYLYLQMENDFIENEKNIIKDINQKNKQKMISPKEIKIMNKKINDAKIKFEEKAEKQKKELYKLWHSRSSILQKLKNPLIKDKFDIDETKEINLEKEKNIKDLVNNKNEYIKKNIKLPPISEILKREIKKRLNKNVKTSNINNRKKINFFYSQNNSISNNNNKIIKKKKNISRIKNLKSVSIQTDKRRNILNLKSLINSPYNFNYLEEIKQKRFLKNGDTKNNILSEDKDEYKVKSEPLNLKSQIELIDSKYKRNKQLLKVQGGYLSNKDLSDNLNELLIGSIKRKLSIIEDKN